MDGEAWADKRGRLGVKMTRLSFESQRERLSFEPPRVVVVVQLGAAPKLSHCQLGAPEQLQLTRHPPHN